MEHIRETHCSEESERGAFFGRLPLSRRKKETKSSVADSIIADVQYYQSMGGNTEVTELEHGPNIRKPSHLRVPARHSVFLFIINIYSRGFPQSQWLPEIQGVQLQGRELRREK